VHEVEALACACERGEQRVGRTIIDPDEVVARAREDRQDAEAFRLLFYTGLRLGEMLTLRWEDVDLVDRMLLVCRGLSAGEESTPKGATPPLRAVIRTRVSALARLAARDGFTSQDDYVLANRHGRRLESTSRTPSGLLLPRWRPRRDPRLADGHRSGRRGHRTRRVR
jgi:integrase